MSTNPLSSLEFTRRTAKRAQYEAFEYQLTPEGVLVRNGSHANPDEHEYLVTVTNGVPTRCECPADEHYKGACKHRVAVAIRRPIIQAATENQLIADGGLPVERKDRAQDVSSGDGGQSSPDSECWCETSEGSFPCWDCVQTGRRSLEDCE
ncbi:SWIM zinc finger domain-containing protein [Natrialbaceae archaeon A-CW3]